MFRRRKGYKGTTCTTPTWGTEIKGGRGYSSSVPHSHYHWVRTEILIRNYLNSFGQQVRKSKSPSVNWILKDLPFGPDTKLTTNSSPDTPSLLERGSTPCHTYTLDLHDDGKTMVHTSVVLCFIVLFLLTSSFLDLGLFWHRFQVYCVCLDINNHIKSISSIIKR